MYYAILHDKILRCLSFFGAIANPVTGRYKKNSLLKHPNIWSSGNWIIVTIMHSFHFETLLWLFCWKETAIDIKLGMQQDNIKYNTPAKFASEVGTQKKGNKYSHNWLLTLVILSATFQTHCPKLNIFSRQ